MKFNFDTQNCENIRLEIESDEYKDISSAIQEFAFGIASFFRDFMMRLNCDTEEKIKAVQEVCMSCVERNLNAMAKDILLDCNEDFICAINSLRDEMENKGFSKDEITVIIQFIEANEKIEENVEVAIKGVEDILMKLNEEHGVETIRKEIDLIREIIQ